MIKTPIILRFSRYASEFLQHTRTLLLWSPLTKNCLYCPSSSNLQECPAFGPRLSTRISVRRNRCIHCLLCNQPHPGHAASVYLPAHGSKCESKFLECIIWCIRIELNWRVPQNLLDISGSCTTSFSTVKIPLHLSSCTLKFPICSGTVSPITIILLLNL